VLENSSGTEQQGPGDSKPDREKPTHYVGIGASAGGLEALLDFFSNTPNDTGAAYIVVQHLSPDFKSFMPELLSKNTTMPIFHSAHGHVVERNTIYLIPPRKHLKLSQGILHLEDMPQDGRLQLPIDSFFNSLAEDQQHKAVGIVLSGTGSDGSRGIRTLKEAGALIMVQNPETSKFDGMPYNVIATGLADFVLDADQIPLRLVQYLSHPLIGGRVESLKSLIESNEDYMNQIFGLLKQKSNIDFSQYKPSTIARRIERRMGINQLSTLKEYFAMILDQPKELQILSKELLIGVTRFFRDPELFSYLEKSVIDELLDRVPANEPIRVWCVACSTGEEPYSIAILFLEALQRRKEKRNVKVFATDVDQDAIAIASAGQYYSDILADVNEHRINRFFHQEGEKFTVTTEVRQMVVFAAHDMIADPPFSNIDLLVCRNALIYFQNPAQKKALVGFHFALKKEGILFLGPSETLGELQSHFKIMNERGKIYAKQSNIRIPLGTPTLRDPVTNTSVNSLKRSKEIFPLQGLVRSRRDQHSKLSPLNFVKDVLINTHVPPTIILDDEFEAIHVYGDVSPYIKRMPAGKVSANIKDMIIDTLSIAVSTAISRAEAERGEAYYSDLVIEIDGKESLLDLQVFYVREKDIPTIPEYYVLTFHQQDKEANEQQRARSTFDMSEQSRRRIQDLENEIKKKEENLQVTVEELETTNEELQSSNEELMSANEELQSTNEELQSVNEELYTVNSEYQEKISELSQANSDLDNIIETSELGILFLDESMLIRKYSPIVTEYFNILNSDLGRPLHHISHNLNYDDLIKDVAKVSELDVEIRKEVYTLKSHCLLMLIKAYNNPYSSGTSGVVISFTNITRMKLVESQLELVAKASNEEEKQFVAKKIRILIIDDLEGDRTYMKRMLNEISQLECDISDCQSVDEGIAHLHARDFDICLLDYQLAKETATDFVNRCHEENLNVPIILISAHTEAGINSSLNSANIKSFINKNNLSPQLLLKSIQSGVNRDTFR